MRRLNEKEKEFCKLIVANEATGINFLEKVFRTELPDYYGEIDSEDKILKLWRDNTQETNSIIINLPGNKRAVETIIIAVKLLVMLEKEGLIYLYKNQPDASPIDIGSGKLDRNKGRAASTFFDKEFTEILIEYYRKGIVVTKDFEEFILNNFITRDDMLKNNEIRNSNWALRISAIAVIVSSIAVAVDCSNNPSNDDFNKLKATVDSIKIRNGKGSSTTFISPNLRPVK